jgi:site-specific recombinase XerD
VYKKRTKDLTKRINKHMKLVGAAIGVDKISTYTARHSYATVLKRSGANIADISESLGHNSLKTTETYLASFEKEERQKNAALLTQF